MAESLAQSGAEEKSPFCRRVARIPRFNAAVNMVAGQVSTMANTFGARLGARCEPQTREFHVKLLDLLVGEMG